MIHTHLFRVINSCQTTEQLDIAMNYCELAFQKHPDLGCLFGEAVALITKRMLEIDNKQSAI